MGLMNKTYINSKADFFDFFYSSVSRPASNHALLVYTSLGVLETGKQDENKPGTKIKAKRKHILMGK